MSRGKGEKGERFCAAVSGEVVSFVVEGRETHSAIKRRFVERVSSDIVM